MNSGYVNDFLITSTKPSKKYLMSFDLSKKTLNALEKNQIQTIEDLKKYTVDQLLSKPSIGVDTIKELLEKEVL